MDALLANTQQGISQTSWFPYWDFDSEIVNPEYNGIVSHDPLSDVPDCPNNSSGVVYQSNFMNSTDGWVGINGVLTQANNSITLTSTSTSYFRMARSASFGTSQFVIATLLSPRATIAEVYGTIGGVGDTFLGSFPLVANTPRTFILKFTGVCTYLHFNLSTSVVIGDWFTCSFVQVGNGSYSSTTTDIIRNLPMTIGSGILKVAGPGTATGIDASYGYLTGSDTGLPAGNAPRSMACWFNTTQSDTTFRPMMIYGGAPYGRCSVSISGGDLVRVHRFDGGASLFFSIAGLRNGTWNLFSFSFDGTNVSGYVNGRLIATQAYYFASTYDRLDVGATANDGYAQKFGGQLSMPRIWNRALSASDHLALYQNPGFYEPYGAIVPILSGDRQDQQQAAVAAFTNLGSMPANPEQGVDWTGAMTGDTTFGEIDSQINTAIGNCGLNYYPKYTILNGNLKVTINKAGS